jgi:hypothetical protein
MNSIGIQGGGDQLFFGWRAAMFRNRKGGRLSQALPRGPGETLEISRGGGDERPFDLAAPVLFTL